MTSGSRRRSSNSKKEMQKVMAKRQDREKGKNWSACPSSQPDALRASSPSEAPPEDPWAPGSYVALKALLSARLCSAIWGIITDCDETYNYWEPTHFLLYGKGFQTWEYSPVFALRSYTYLMVHVVPALAYARLLQPNRTLVFFFVRCVLAIVASLTELYFYRGVCIQLGANMARIALGISVFSAGMFIASTAFLPSSFAMYMTFLSYGAWFHGSLELAIFATALSAFLGWPFAALVGLPIAYDIVVRKRKTQMFLKWCFISSFTILVPMVQMDSRFLGRLTVAPLNLFLYNVVSPSSSSSLYGTAPPSFYLLNGILNFNIIFPAAIIAIPAHVLWTYSWGSTPPVRRPSLLPPWLPLASLYVWLLVFLLQPHKEERFLYPVYPLVCLAAALTIDTLQKAVFSVLVRRKRSHFLPQTNWVSILILALSSTLSISRIVGQYQGYRAPFDTFLELQQMEADGRAPGHPSVSVCLGKEWHRFPSSFFLPTLDWEVRFLKSEFQGQLPQMFAPGGNGTSLIPPNMNNQNKEEPSRYVPSWICHFIVDMDTEPTPREPRYSYRSSEWTIVHRVPFLDAARSPQFLRAFYIPFLTERYCKYNDYVILQSNKLKKLR